MGINAGIEIENLLEYALRSGLLERPDVIPARNALLDLFGLTQPASNYRTNARTMDESVFDRQHDLPSPVPILHRLLDYAADQGLLQSNTPLYRDLFETRIMGVLMPRASEVVRQFRLLLKEDGPKAATDWFYQLSQRSNYIRMDRIANNEYWTVDTEYGELEMTINLSKPEKDPKEIAALKSAPRSSYPLCVLCADNVGYAGRIDHPARQNHRIIPITLCNETWFLQFSPYVYYNEHSIILSEAHRPMRIDRNTFERLFAFVQQFPHYFAGSNADLPIVGGSILNHDHYQGGRHKFAMEKAPVEKMYTSDDYPQVKIGRVKWPMSVLRIASADKDSLIALADHLQRAWRSYSDPEADVLHASTDATGKPIPHNTVTPIARINQAGEFELDIVLRNNRTSEAHPDGIFHPHQELHPIKKENIGLIEVMGLAVLPGRLQQQLRQIADWLADLVQEHRNDDMDVRQLEYQVEQQLPQTDSPLHPHADWMRELALRFLRERSYGQSDLRNDIRKKLYQETGLKFVEVLSHCGVFKRNEAGLTAFDRFIAAAGLIERT